jgi:hypothetical protein
MYGNVNGKDTAPTLLLNYQFLSVQNKMQLQHTPAVTAY